MQVESASPESTSFGVARAAEWLARALANGDLPPLLATIGLGQGHLLQVLDQVAPGTRVLALEPDSVVANAFLRRADQQVWRESGRLVYLIGPDYEGADEAWRIFPSDPDRHLVLIEPDTAKRDPGAAVAAARVLKGIVFGARANATARRTFAPVYLANTLRNLPAIARGSDVRALSGAYTGVPAVVVGAGPSLDRMTDELAEAGRRALVIATDTALRPLLSAGIAPALAVGADPGARNARHFRALPSLDDVCLVAESGIDPGAASEFGGRAFWFRLADHEPWPWYQSIGIDIGRLRMWGSVLTAAFQTAVLAGCDPIVFVGSDLAFTGGRPYARGTTYEFDWGVGTALGHLLEDVWRNQRSMHERCTAQDVRGQEVESSTPLVAFRDWLVLHAERCGRRVINASGAGILTGPGIELASIGDALTKRIDVPKVATIRRSRSASVPDHELARHCQVLAADLERSDMTKAPLPAWEAFLGQPLSTGVLQAALTHAGSTLESAAAPEQLPQSPAVRLIASGSSSRQLPEGLSRLRSWLHCQPIRAADASERAHRLAAALPLVAEAIRQLAGLGATDARPDVGEDPLNPVCVQRHWPPNLAWLLQLAESLIGEACCAPQADGHVQRDTFWVRGVFPRQEQAAPPEPVHAGVEPTLVPHIAQLIREWVDVLAEMLETDPALSENSAARDRLRVVRNALSVALAGGANTDASTAEAALVVASSTDAASIRLEWPIGPAAQLARAATGFLTPVAEKRRDETGLPPRRRSGDARIDLALRLGKLTWPLGRAGKSSSVVTPRVLTDEGLERSMVTGTARDGALCASLHGHSSFVLSELGDRTHEVLWPRPLCGTLPFGETGWLAWGNGTHDWPHVGDGYLMVLENDRAAPRVEELSCRPTTGVWWKGSVYWSTFPTGLASWTPGRGTTVLDRTLAIIGMSVDDVGLLCVTGQRTDQGHLVRTAAHDSWRWSPSTGLSRLINPVVEPATCRSTDNGWLAAAYLDEDALDIHAPDGRVTRLLCYYPFGAAWAGSSLLVSTVEGEVLLFENLRQMI
jgi:hypothetical protein